VGAAGRVRIVDAPTFPAHPFFLAGKEFPLRLRHGTLQFEDAAMDIRSAALRFSDQGEESPLDLVMNTGPASAFWNIPSFMDFIKAKRAGKQALIAWSVRSPRGRDAAIGALRRAPESFSLLSYYAQLVFAFQGTDGVRRWVKYRLVPWDEVPESGLPSANDLLRPWDQERLADEHRSKHYLAAELTERLSQGQVKFRLQLQLHTPAADDSQELLNSSLPWDEATHPWHELAAVILERSLSAEETERLTFNIGHQPPSLGVLPAKSPEDYNSLGYLRTRVYGAAQRARLS
jgi:arachidonate 5-lipoxygenase